MKAKLIFLLTVILSLTSCQKYEDFIEDYDYSTTYFAYQRPIRTVFSDDPSIEIGVVLGGKRENKIDERVTFQIEPTMLQNVDYVGNNQFKILPEDYYSLSDNHTIIIPKGKFLGTIKYPYNSIIKRDFSDKKNWKKFLTLPQPLTILHFLCYNIV